MPGEDLGILTNIKIEGFKSIKKMDLTLNPLNIIIGPNGVGKSNFVGFFKFLNNLVNKELEFYIAQNGNADKFLYLGAKETEYINILINFRSGNAYESSLKYSIGNKLIFEKEIAWLKDRWDDLRNIGGTESKLDLYQSSDYKSYKADWIKNYLKDVRVYHFHDVSNNAPIKHSSDVSNNAFLQMQADNIASMLYRFKENYNAEYMEIISTVRLIAPFFKDFMLKPDDNKKTISLRWIQSGVDRSFDVYDLSDGTLRFIALAVLLLQPVSLMPQTILVDEPELGLHPYALKILAELMKGAVKKGKQVIATSQSVDLINEFNSEDIIIADRKGQESVFRRLEEKEIKQWIEEFSIGDIWSRNIIGGNPNEF